MVALATFYAVLLLLNLYRSEGYNDGQIQPMGRARKLLDIPWWFGNDRDPVTGPTHDGYLKGRPAWYRKLRWGIRNPLNNFTYFVVGLADSPFMRRYQGHDEQGKERQWPIEGGLNVRPPFVSYRNDVIEGYAGWKPNGQFSIAIRRSGSRSY